MPIGGVQRAVVKALRYARTLSADVRAVYVEIDPAATEALRRLWGQWGQGVHLIVLASPYRSLMEPLLEYIDQIRRSDPAGYVTVILPEFVPRRLWHHLLHNQHALLIKAALLFRPNVVVTSVPFHLGRGRPTGMSSSDEQRRRSGKSACRLIQERAMKRALGAAPPFRQPARVSEYPPRVRGPFVLGPITGALATVAAGWLIARVMYALPWPADALLATMLASAWCRWLETREPL